MDGEAIFFTGRSRAERGKAKNLWGGAGLGTLYKGESKVWSRFCRFDLVVTSGFLHRQDDLSSFPYFQA